jgi:hypothetical protein
VLPQELTTASAAGAINNFRNMFHFISEIPLFVMGLWREGGDGMAKLPDSPIALAVP